MNNPVEFGTVEAMPHADIWDKEFPKKVLEEAAEVYSAWEMYTKYVSTEGSRVINLICLNNILAELADLTQTVANMVKAVQDEVSINNGDVLVDAKVLEKTHYSLKGAINECHKRNEERGRYEIEGCENDAARKRD